MIPTSQLPDEIIEEGQGWFTNAVAQAKEDKGPCISFLVLTPSLPPSSHIFFVVARDWSGLDFLHSSYSFHAQPSYHHIHHHHRLNHLPFLSPSIHLLFTFHSPSINLLFIFCSSSVDLLFIFCSSVHLLFTLCSPFFTSLVHSREEANARKYIHIFTLIFTHPRFIFLPNEENMLFLTHIHILLFHIRTLAPIQHLFSSI